MKLIGLGWRSYRIPYATQFATAHGRTLERRGLLLQLRTDSGIEGVGDAAPVVEFGDGTVEQSVAALRSVTPDLIGLDLWAIATILESSFGAFRALRCAIDTAIFDAMAQACGSSVASLLASEVASAVPVNATIGAESRDATVTAARRAVAAGFRVIKLKVGQSGTLENEVDRIQAVRGAIGPSVALRIDANGAWDPETAIEVLRSVEPCRLDLVEQPVPAAELAGLVRVRRAVSVPIAADEAIVSLASARAVLAQGAADAIIVKPMVVGGLTEARRIIELCGEQGCQVIVTSSIESGVGVAAALHLAATLPPPIPACGLATAELLAADLLTEPLPVQSGMMPLPARPGLGVVLDDAQLRICSSAVQRVGSFDH